MQREFALVMKYLNLFLLEVWNDNRISLAESSIIRREREGSLFSAGVDAVTLEETWKLLRLNKKWATKYQSERGFKIPLFTLIAFNLGILNLHDSIGIYVSQRGLRMFAKNRKLHMRKEEKQTSTGGRRNSKESDAVLESCFDFFNFLRKEMWLWCYNCWYMRRKQQWWIVSLISRSSTHYTLCSRCDKRDLKDRFILSFPLQPSSIHFESWKWNVYLEEIEFEVWTLMIVVRVIVFMICSWWQMYFMCHRGRCTSNRLLHVTFSKLASKIHLKRCINNNQGVNRDICMGKPRKFPRCRIRKINFVNDVFDISNCTAKQSKYLF